MKKLRHATEKLIDNTRGLHVGCLNDEWTFTNDIDTGEALELLITAQALSKYFRGFTVPELQKLCNILNFFVLKNGVDVLKKGEQASFFALILEGRIDLLLPPGTDGGERSVPMYRGDTLGDITYFMGGSRTGNCRCKQNGTVVAILAFPKVAAWMEIEPALVCKIVWMLAKAAFQKLHEDKLRTEPPER